MRVTKCQARVPGSGGQLGLFCRCHAPKGSSAKQATEDFTRACFSFCFWMIPASTPRAVDGEHCQCLGVYLLVEVITLQPVFLLPCIGPKSNTMLAAPAAPHLGFLRNSTACKSKCCVFPRSLNFGSKLDHALHDVKQSASSVVSWQIFIPASLGPHRQIA